MSDSDVVFGDAGSDTLIGRFIRDRTAGEAGPPRAGQSSERVTRDVEAEKDNIDPAHDGSRSAGQILIHYDEIALKGGNRRAFEKCLQSSVKRAIKGCGVDQVRRTHGRLIAELSDNADIAACTRRLGRVTGVTQFYTVTRLSGEFDAITRWLAQRFESRPLPDVKTFAVACKRANKDLPHDSLEVNRRIGQAVVDLQGWKVDLDHPDLTIHIRLVDQYAYVGFDRHAGPGGLPIGSTGKVVILLSGGIDSPVAASQMLRRGAAPCFVHFHSHPHTSSESQDKVRELARIILPHGHRAKLYMIAFADTQQQIIMNCPANLRVILYRRFMMRAAEAVARKERALATVTGDSLGQVASQTLENMNSIHAVTKLPTLRPLIGLNKVHIVREAIRIGTYELSIEPHDDCCSYLMPDHPATRSNPAQLDAAEESMEVAREVEQLLASSTIELVVGSDETC